jgi:hypothetical protein
VTYRNGLLLALVAVAVVAGSAQTPAPPRAARAAEPPHNRPAVMTWRLAPADQRYATIDAGKLMQDVEAQTAMSRRYRDAGHQFWGRITGTEADAENAKWMADRFRTLGLTDVHEQTFDLQPQWLPDSWSVVASSKGKTLKIETAQPTYLSVGTTAEGLDLEAVYVGMASDAELATSKDVKGKAVFVYSIDTSSRHIGVQENAIKRLSDRGAAAIFVIQGIPGNLTTQFYPVNAPVPTFSMGQRDGFAMRDLIALSGEPTHVKVKLDVKRVPNLKSRTVFGTLPGMTDETVVVVAHRDGWFEGANDNAAGVATALSLAEFFSKMPKEERKRTIIFAGTTGHHDNGAESGAWFTEHPEFFAKTAVLLNAEHTGAMATGQNSTRMLSGAAGSTWFAGGDALAGIVAKALDTFGVVTYAQSAGSPAGEIGRYHQYAPAMQIMTSGFVWHSNEETAASISPSGLVAITRTYAKVIVDSNALSLQDLRKSIAPAATRQ